MNNKQNKKTSNQSPKVNAKPYSPTTYRIVVKDTIKIYSPNVVSVRKKIISA